jgi:hypothetical protein
MLMEIEQIIKRVEWLDDIRRKDQTAVAALENRRSKAHCRHLHSRLRIWEARLRA